MISYTWKSTLWNTDFQRIVHFLFLKNSMGTSFVTPIWAEEYPTLNLKFGATVYIAPWG